MSTSRLAAACDPSQWVQSLIAINVQINKATYSYAILKGGIQVGLSMVTAVTCIPACGTEIIKLVGDISCKTIGGAIRVVQYIGNPEWLESFYQIVSHRPSLSHRVERIVGQAFGLFISACGIFLRDDWAIQQHQSLGNYIPSKTSPAETPEIESPSQASEAPILVPTSPHESSEETPPPQASQAATAPLPPPSAKAGTLLKSALKASPKTPAPPPADDTGSSPLPNPASPSEGQAASSEPPPEAPPTERKKKGVRVVSTPTNAAKPPPSPLDEIKRKGETQSAKGEELAAKLQEEERSKQGKKPLSEEGKAMSDALTSTKKKARRIQSAYFEDYKEGLGRPVQGGIILRDLQKELDIAFSEDESMLAKTFGEYVLLKFAENSIPIEFAEKCELKDCWDKKFTIEILKVGKDTESGKDIILQAAVDWVESS